MKLRNIKPSRIKKVLLKNGFEEVNVVGSHFYYKKNDRLVCVVDHNNQELGYQSISSIIRQSGIQKNDWVQELS